MLCEKCNREFEGEGLISKFDEIGREWIDVIDNICPDCKEDIKEPELVDQPTNKDLEEELSDCCGAEIVAETFCKKCKEPCK